MSAMKERPILFSGAMVRAILEGRKTVTRRALNAQSLKNIGYGVQLGECHELPDEGSLHPNSVDYYNDFCPYGQPGERLWVRETTESNEVGSATLARYAADKAPVLYSGCEDSAYNGSVAHWDYPRASRPSIHMNRWACRILLEITAVRVERLQDISTEQIIAEGLSTTLREHDAEVDLRRQWRELWESTGGDWKSNPWVWVVEFKRIEQ